jgi:hypothetical protein
MSDNTQLDVQQSISDRLNAKLKENLIDLIPPEVLQQKAEQAAAYFLNGKTHFGYNGERERYNIMHDKDTLVGMIYAEMQKKAAASIKQALDEHPALVKNVWDVAAREAAHDAIQTIIKEDPMTVLANMVSNMMLMHLQGFQGTFEQNLRNRGVMV